MAIPKRCPKCGGDLVQYQDGETWYCAQGDDLLRDESKPKCRYHYSPTRRDIIELMKEEFPDPPPPPGRPVFGVSRPEDYKPTDWEKEIPPFSGRAL